MRAVPLVAMLLSISCGRARTETTVKRDPAIASASTKATAIVPLSRRVVQGKLVDLDEHRVVRTLDEGLPAFETSDATFGALASKDGTLRGYDLATGKDAWSIHPTAPCRGLVLGGRSLFCVASSHVEVLDRKSGTSRTFVASPASKLVQAIVVGSKLVVRHEDSTLDIVDANGGSIDKTIKPSFPILGWRATIFALENAEGFCAVAPDGNVQIACFDVLGGKKYQTTITLRKPTDPPTSFVVRQITAHHMVVSSLFFGTIKRGVVFRVRDGVEVARVEEELASVVENEEGALDSLLVVQPEVRVLETSGKLRWGGGKLAGHDEGAAAVVRGDRIFAAIYPPISSGSKLYAFDRSTGKIVWKGDVELLPIGHSEYFNEVFLSLHGRDVVLRGDESSLTYFETFDLESGKRTYSDARMR